MRRLKICSLLSLAIILSLLVTVISAAPALALTGAISISPTYGPVDTAVTITGTGFTPSSTYTLYYAATAITTGTISGTGILSTSFAVPASTAGAQAVTATTTAPDTSNTVTFTVTPQITLSSTSVQIGNSIYVYGSGFGPSLTVTIYIDSVSTTTTPTNTSGSFSVSLTVPSGAGGSHTVTATDTSLNTASTTYTITPSVTLSSSSVVAGSQLTVNGTSFAASSTVTIYIDSVSTITTTTNASGSFSVSLTVSQGVSGSHTLTATDSLSNSKSVTYSITPSITINPSSFTSGSQVTVNGTGFAASSNITFYMDGVPISGSTATANTLGSFSTSNLVIPTVSGGTHTFQAKDSSSNSATLSFSVTQGITINPQSGPSGTVVQVTGEGFSASKAISIKLDGTGVVASPSTPATDASGDFTASFTVPAIFGGSHSVVVSDGTFSVTASFNVTSSANLNLIRGSVETSVTVSGNSFASRGAILVTYDSISVATTTADNNGTFSTTFNVPASSTGTHTVIVTDGTRNMPFNFSVVANVTISPTSGYVSTSITLTGTGFASGGQITIKYDASQIGTVTADATGGFAAVFKAPASQGGNRSITVTDGTSTIVSTFAMDSTPPPTPTLLSPPNDTQADALAEFQWKEVTDPSGVTYVLQVSRDSNFSVLVLEKKGLTTPGYQLTEEDKLASASKKQPYYWRVKAIDGASNESPWTPAQSFYVGFVLATQAFYTILGFCVLIAGLLGFWLGVRSKRK